MPPPGAGSTTRRATPACNIERGDTRRDVAHSIVGRGGFRASRKESQPEAVDGEQRSTGHAGRHWLLVHRCRRNPDANRIPRQVDRASCAAAGDAVERTLSGCAVTRRRFPVGESPTRQLLQPDATGATVEVTKRLKPSVKLSRNTVTARVCRP